MTGPVDAGTARHAERLYLVRHGRTELSVRGGYSGRRDVALSDEGREQAQRVAERLRGAGVDAVFSSPLSRAADTARAIAEATGAPLHVDARLTEVDYGPIEGFDRAGAHERFGEAFQAWRDDPLGAPLAGMEPLREALERAREATDAAIATSRCPVIVGHQGILRLVLVALGGIDASTYFDTRFEEAEPSDHAAVVQDALKALTGAHVSVHVGDDAVLLTSQAFPPAADEPQQP